jgi:diguanylate cyclase (GGDEF)-like protein/PAS domain S-box-containing protein
MAAPSAESVPPTAPRSAADTAGGSPAGRDSAPAQGAYGAGESWGLAGPGAPGRPGDTVGSSAPPSPWNRLGAWLRRPPVSDDRQLPWLVLLVGLLFTALVVEHNRRLNQEAHGRIAHALLDDVADAIQGKLQQDIETVNGVAGLFNAAGTVSRQDFRRYVASLNREQQTLNGIQGIGFTRFLPESQRQAVEAGVRAEGFADFRIRPETPRPYLSTILYLEPFDLRNQRAFGFDMYSEAVRREAMDRAALSGLPAMSGKVTLLQETSTGIQAGVLMYVPIYGPGVLTVPHSTADYPQKLVGWAYSPLRVGDLVEAALATVNNPDLPGASVLVYDGDRALPERLIFARPTSEDPPQLREGHLQRINTAGRSWLIGVQLSPSQIPASGFSRGLAMLALAGGLTTTVATLVTELLVAGNGRTRAALAAAERARNELALAAVVFDASPQAIVVSDPQGRVISANQSFARITGYTGTEILGRTLSLLKSGRHDAGFYRTLWQSVQERGFWQGEIWNRVRDGEVRRHELSITAVRNLAMEVIHYVGMIQDINDRHQAQERVRHRALHDPLTGLANRSLLQELTEQAMALAERHRHGVALLYLDLDGFKPINDQHGHAVGDRVLQAVARLVVGAIRASDTLARLGGDEFVVLVPRLIGSDDELAVLARRVREAVDAVAEEIGEAAGLSVSVGIACSPQHGESVEQLMAAADAAMYRAKRNRDKPVQLAEPIRPGGRPAEPALNREGSPG